MRCMLASGILLIMSNFCWFSVDAEGVAALGAEAADGEPDEPLDVLVTGAGLTADVEVDAS